MSNTKNKTVREQVESRLKEIGYWPCPPAGIEAIVSKVNTKVSALVRETMKSWAAVSQLVMIADPNKEPAKSKPPAAESGK